MTANQFYIDSYHAWVPGIEEQQGDWSGFFSNQWQPTDAKADVSFLPAMQRRRLSPLARAAVNVIDGCGVKNEPMIFCTRYGEVDRTDGILRDIATQQEVSPTAFGLSVFNAIAGQISILQKNTSAMTTLVPSEDDYLTAFADALGRLQQGETSVTLVFYEEPLSEVLSPYCYPLPCIMALAVRLVAKPTAPIQKPWLLSYHAASSSNAQTYQAGAGIIELLRFFTLQQSHIQLGQWKIATA